MKTTRKRKIRLTAAAVRTLKTPGRYCDQQMPTLMLLVTQAGGRSWVQRIVHADGIRRDHGLGPYPLVSLAEARDIAFSNRQAVHRGEDPFTTRKAPTFAQAAEKTLDAHRTDWAASTRAHWLAPVANHVLPAIGDLPLDKITRQHVIDLLDSLLAEKSAGYVRRLHKSIRAVFTWAQGAGHVDHNVAADGGITAALPALRHVEHEERKALPYKQMPAAFRQIADSGACDSANACVQFLILTGVRNAEARKAEWTEIDLDAREWRIPAARMKSRRAHVVPLSDAALAILDSMKGRSEVYVFPSPRTRRPLTDVGLTGATRHMDATIHGSRATFSTWANETTDHAHETIEAAIANVTGSAVSRRYNRSEFVEKRRKLMADWAEYLVAA